MRPREAAEGGLPEETLETRVRPPGGGRGFLLRRVAAVLGLLVLPTVAVAHARLVRSTPADGASLTSTPGPLALCFNELLEREFHTIEIAAEPGPSGRSPRPPVVLAATVDPGNGTCLTATLPSLEPGHYVARWRVVSRDGHTTRGLIRFRVG